jgi:hypothetical protein
MLPPSRRTKDEDKTMKTSAVSRASRTGIALLALAILSAGCTSTRVGRRAPAESGFLGDYPGLQENSEFPAALVYVKPGVPWAKYNAIEIESAGVSVTDTSTAPSPEDRTVLAGLLHNTMTEELGKYFALVTTPAPNALRVRTAWTQAANAKALGWVDIPQLRITTDVRDSVSGEPLAAALDARAETKAAFGRSAYETWGENVQPAIDYWSKRCAWQLWRLGVQLKPDATPPEPPKKPKPFFVASWREHDR